MRNVILYSFIYLFLESTIIYLSLGIEYLQHIGYQIEQLHHVPIQEYIELMMSKKLLQNLVTFIWFSARLPVLSK
jgi:hypothetical protein